MNTVFDAQRVPHRLTEIGRALTYATSLDEVLRLTVECAGDLLKAGPVLLLLKNQEGTLEVRASHGFDGTRGAALNAPMDELLIERLQEVFGPDASERFIAVPLVVAGEITGLLAAAHAPKADMDEAAWLLSALADQASIALETSRLAEARGALETQVGALTTAVSSKEQALRIISHDLRTPLSTIISYVELLESGVLGEVNDRQRGALARVRESGQHLISLLQNVLEMTRLSAGAVQIDQTRLSLQAAVREAAAVAMTAKAPNHSIEILGDDVVAYADPVRVRQVLIHLLDNAVKYTPAGSHIRVSCSIEDADQHPWARLRVEDDGPGIEPDRLDRIFEPYERGTGGDAPGSGLGLAIARGLIEKMGGRIEAESAVGRGAAFTVRLPAG